MTLDTTRSSEYAARHRKIGALSFGPNQRGLIEEDPGVQRTLGDITARMFAGTQYAPLNHGVSRYALMDDGGGREFLYGQHMFAGVGDVVTLHELHDVTVSLVHNVGGEDVVLRGSSDDIKFVLDAADPADYGSVPLFTEDSIATIEALMIADEKDAGLRGVAQSN